MNSLLSYLTENCCGGAASARATVAKPNRKRTKELV
jgi:hypothetical protein